MSSKFLSGSGTDVSDGSTTIFGSTIGATNLKSGTAVKVNSTGNLYSTDLEIDDTTGLQTALDASASNPATANLNMNANRIVNMSDPVDVGDAVNKQYLLANSGTGDFLADGSVPMTGTLDMGTNTIYGSNNIGGSLTFGSTSDAAKGQIICEDELSLPDGTAALPSYSFTSDLNSGMSADGVGGVVISSGGGAVATFDSDVTLAAELKMGSNAISGVSSLTATGDATIGGDLKVGAVVATNNQWLLINNNSTNKCHLAFNGNASDGSVDNSNGICLTMSRNAMNDRQFMVADTAQMNHTTSHAFRVTPKSGSVEIGGVTTNGLTVKDLTVVSNMLMDGNSISGISTITTTSDATIGGNLNMTSTEDIFHPPSLTSTQQVALTPSSGDVIFNTDHKTISVHNDIQWSPLANKRQAACNRKPRIFTVDEWTSRSAVGSKRRQTIIWSDELEIFVAVAIVDTPSIQWSEDGITWASATGTGSLLFQDVAWSPELGIFCAVGNNSTDLATSSDGKAWTSVAGTPVKFGITWCSNINLFIACAEVGTIYTSTDGTTWISQTLPAGTYYLYNVKWSSELGLAVVVGNGVGSTSAILTSPDGKTWTSRTFAGFGTYSLWGICYSPELCMFLAPDYSSTTQSRAVISYDGITWTAHSTADDTVKWKGCAWSPELGLFITMAYQKNSCQTSPDGINWTEVVISSAGAAEPFSTVTWSSKLGIFAAVSNQRTTSNIWTSGFGIGLEGGLTVGGSGSIAGDLKVDGNSTIDGDLKVNSDSTIAGDLTVAGDSTIDGDLKVNGDIDLTGSLTIGGTGVVASSTDITTTTLWVMGAIAIGGSTTALKISKSGNIVSLMMDDFLKETDGAGRFESVYTLPADYRPLISVRCAVIQISALVPNIGFIEVTTAGKLLLSSNAATLGWADAILVGFPSPSICYNVS